MLSNKYPSIRLGLLVCLLSLSTACSDASWIQRALAPDAKLNDKKEVDSSKNSQQERQTEHPSVKPANDFTKEIPVYPEAKLEGTDQEGRTRWISTDSSDRIISYYKEQFQSNNWAIDDSETQETTKTIVARQNNRQITVSILPKSQKGENSAEKTEFTIEYQKDQKTVKSYSDESESQQTSTSLFSDLDAAPQQLRQLVEEVAALGILSGTGENKEQFEPNKTITRREYARWLVAANNRFYAHNLSQQIHLSLKTEEPIFKDVPSSDRDFIYIQGLAEAGLIPSILTGDSTEVLFRPDAPLTREKLILWKVPLDIRKSLPSASIEAVNKTWGFEDTAKIETKALRSLYADFQNGNKSNVRRVFGYTILFRPKKTVTRAEAAAALWYFGFQAEGISAKEARKLKN